MSKKTSTEAETKPVVLAPQTKRYDAAFRKAAVKNWLTSGRSGTQIAAELGISYSSLKEWKRRYDGDAMPRRDDLAAEIRALHRMAPARSDSQWVPSGRLLPPDRR